MTLSSTTNRTEYAGNGVTTAFSFPYKFNDDGDLTVILRSSAGVETTKTITTHYTVSGAGEEAGGTVTMLTAPATGEDLVIIRDPDLTQETNYVENDALPAESTEDALDLLTMIAQRLDDRIERSVQLSDGNTDTFDPTLPADIATADVLVKVNSDGDGFETATIADIGDFSFPGGNGLLAKTGTLTAAARTLTGTDGQIDVANGSGASGNPTLTLSAAILNSNRSFTQNLGVACSVAASALTIALKQADGSTNPASTGPVRVGHRSTTLTSGAFTIQVSTAASTIVVPSTATLGHQNAVEAFIYCYRFFDGTTKGWMISSQEQDETVLHTPTLISSGATSIAGKYCDFTPAGAGSITHVCTLKSTQTTAGTWAAVPTNIGLKAKPLIVPTVQKFTSGSGTYTTPAGVKHIRVRMVGGGGGGAGSSTNAAANGGTGGTGGNTTFGSSLLVANGGVGGSGSGLSGGAGGTASLGTGPIGIAFSGSYGNSGGQSPASVYTAGGHGGNSPLGGAGMGGVAAAGTNAITNSGSGGGGGSGGNSAALQNNGSGGGAGGFVDSIIAPPAATYAYAVGSAGTAGTAGTSGAAGGTGGSGIIIVEEYY